MNQTETNPFEYQYKPNTLVEIPANVLLNMMYFCEKVIKSQPNMGVPYVYPTDVKEKRNEDEQLIDISVNWKPYEDLTMFLKTIETPLPMATELTILAEQTYYSFSQMHQKNIEAGVAQKVGELTKEQEEEAVEKVLKTSKK